MSQERDGLLLSRVSVDGVGVADIRLESSVISELAPTLSRRRGEAVLDGRGGTVLPGFHDHHIHLRALAAADISVPVGPPEVTNEHQLAATMRRADADLTPGRWLRATGYHESVAGPLDRRKLDLLVPHRPVRIQHRSGILWMLNSAALAAIDAERSAPAGLERDEASTPTGRLWRQDGWLRSRLPEQPLDLGQMSARAAALGVTGYTDATPLERESDAASLAEQAAAGIIVQRLHLMSAPGVTPTLVEGASVGPIKVVLDDDRLPDLADLVDRIQVSHRMGRPVAIHCVTRTQAAFAVAAIEAAGPLGSDRIEHGAVLDGDLMASIKRLKVTVVTQPGFVYSRGDQYLDEVDPQDQPDLWRLGSLIDAGVAVAAGSDAPFGPDDPWTVVRAATERMTSSGRRLGVDERLPLARALRLLQGRAERPTTARAVLPGQPADLCVLSEPLHSIVTRPIVSATIVAGRVVHQLL